MFRMSLLKSIKKFTNIRHNSECLSFGNILRNAPYTQCSLLENGVTLATEERESSHTCVGVFVDAGSRFEKDTENGLAHLHEHMLLKGTFDQSKVDIEAQISNIGATFTCDTTRELVAYTAQCISQDMPTAINILLDSIFKNAFNESEIEIQKSLIYQEMLEYDANSKMLVFDYLHSSAYQGTGLGKTVMGTTGNLCKFKAVSLSAYVNRLFRPQRTILVAVGPVNHEDLINFGNQYFCKDDYITSIPMGPCRYTGSELRYRDDSMHVAHVGIAVEGPSYCSPDRLTMELATTILGGWDKSQPGGINHGTRLARAASSGLSDSYEAFNLRYRDTSLWGVHYISQRESVDDMMSMIQDEWMRLCQTITDEELIQAKRELKSKILLKVESAHDTCKEIGEWCMYTGNRPPLLERFKAIDTITAQNFKDVCTKYIYDRCPVIVGVGSTECLGEYSRVKAGTTGGQDRTWTLVPGPSRIRDLAHTHWITVAHIIASIVVIYYSLHSVYYLSNVLIGALRKASKEQTA